ATEGGDNIDKRYLENINLAKHAGLKVGSYHFYRPRVDQKTQLQNFRAQCRPQDQDLIPMIDVEVTGGLSATALCDSLHKFLKLVEQEYKQKPLVYTGQNFYNKYLAGYFEDYLFMIAKYSDGVPQLNGNPKFALWQFSASGRIKGIRGAVDQSCFMDNYSLRDILIKRR
ncbi:MAG: glycosyl hydrolase family 25, partial [Bacteroidaceae bacterium]|nr:glycosyl hydrolase family 25 [Bacteroidaceae bacterium]